MVEMDNVKTNLNQVRELAQLCREINEQYIQILSDLPQLECNIPTIGLRLLKASFDHARGFCILLEHSPIDLAAPALAVHRSQIESFLRGVYLSFFADENQIKDFIENDEGIRERTGKGKWDKIKIQKLSSIVDQFINDIPSDKSKHQGKLSKMTITAWKILSGFVHGGSAIQTVYIDSKGQIGCDMSASSVARIAGNCFVIMNFTFAVIITKVHQLPEIQLGDELILKVKKFQTILKSCTKR